MIGAIVANLLIAKARFSVRCATVERARDLSNEVRVKLDEEGAPWRWNAQTGRIDLGHPDGPAVHFLGPNATAAGGFPVLLSEVGDGPSSMGARQSGRSAEALARADRQGFFERSLFERIARRKAPPPDRDVIGAHFARATRRCEEAEASRRRRRAALDEAAEIVRAKAAEYRRNAAALDRLSGSPLVIDPQTWRAEADRLEALAAQLP